MPEGYIYSGFNPVSAVWSEEEYFLERMLDHRGVTPSIFTATILDTWVTSKTAMKIKKKIK